MFVSDHEHKTIINHYRCGACWDQLVAHLVDGKISITCVNCGEHVPGFVSSKYVERRQSESHAQYMEAKAALKNAWPFLFPQTKSIKANLQDLGF